MEIEMAGEGTSNGRRLRVAAVGDLHVHKIYHGELRPIFAEISEKADALVICGDLTNVGMPEEAEHLAADLSTLRIPVVAVLGNHDLHSGRGEEIKAALRKANVTFLDDEPRQIDGVGFAGVKGFGGGFSERMLAPFGEDMTKAFVSEAVNQALALENALRSLETERKVVVLHYAPVADTVRGEAPEIMPFMGCSRLAETIDRFEVAAVFHGHAHHGTPRGVTHKGIPVFNCCMELLKRTEGQPYVVVEV